jgi:hypothetical protein
VQGTTVATSFPGKAYMDSTCLGQGGEAVGSRLADHHDAQDTETYGQIKRQKQDNRRDVIQSASAFTEDEIQFLEKLLQT